jgi:hypothetical protein
MQPDTSSAQPVLQSMIAETAKLVCRQAAALAPTRPLESIARTLPASSAHKAARSYATTGRDSDVRYAPSAAVPKIGSTKSTSSRQA